MCVAAMPPAIAALSGATALSAYGTYTQGQTAAAVARNNQVMAGYAAQDAERRGEEDAMKVRRQTSQVVGAQRSRLGANGVDLGVGTAAELQDQANFFGQMDSDTTRFNAKRSAWQARASGDQAAALGRAEAQQASIGAFSTLLSGAGQVAGKWQTYKGK